MRARLYVQELLGQSLEDLVDRCGGRFSLACVCTLAEQMIARIEHVHSKVRMPSVYSLRLPACLRVCALSRAMWFAM